MIWFVRHGETDFNKFSITQGQLDSSLNQTGLEQSKQVAKKLKNEKFDIVFCSPLIRARQTLDAIMKYHTAKIVYDKRIIEHGRGSLSGYKNTKEQYAEFFKNPHKFGGESSHDIYKRVSLFVKSLEKYRGKNILIVGHGGVSKYIKFCLEHKNFKKESPISTDIANCGIMKFDF